VSLDARHVSEDQKNNLCDIEKSCLRALEDTTKELSKYSSLMSKEGTLQGRAKRVWKRVKWEPDDIRDLRSRIISNITALNAVTGANIRDTVFKLEARQDRQESQEIFEWLTPIDTTAQQSDFIRQRQSGTCQWFLDSAEYNNWKLSKSEVLFCHGIPGAGKTILASIVVDDLQDTFGIERDVAISYFYCNFKRQDEQELDDVLSSFLKQLSQAAASIPEGLKALFAQCQSKRSRPSHEKIMKTLFLIAGSFSRTFIVVDALDECQTSNGFQRELTSCLIELQRTAKVNILVTSRPVPQIMERYKAYESLEIRASVDDINKYVETNFANLPGFIDRNQKLQDDIKEEITKAVDGM
jgi:MinD-like ATPase involved in chromosome partitioning or flagellar assembly